jgi:hypothetical protein
MDRLEEIRQRTEAGGPIRRIDMKYLLSEVDRLTALHKREIIITGEYAQRVIDLTARAEAAESALTESQRREREAVKDLSQDAHCTLCKHHRSEGGDCIGVSMCAVKGMRVGWEWRGPQEAGKGDAPNE